LRGQEPARASVDCARVLVLPVLLEEEASIALCKDTSLRYLNSLGYNVVRLPRTGIEPLDLLGKDGKSVKWLGRLDHMWSSSRLIPQAKPSPTVASINGQKTDGLKLSVGLEMHATFPVSGQPGGEASVDLQPAVLREQRMIVVR
jgi:hypothetical protein